MRGRDRDAGKTWKPGPLWYAPLPFVPGLKPNDHPLLKWQINLSSQQEDGSVNDVFAHRI